MLADNISPFNSNPQYTTN